MRIFNNTPFIFNEGKIIGFNYDALKDNIKWNGLKKKKYIPLMLTFINHFIGGLSKRAKK